MSSVNMTPDHRWLLLPVFLGCLAFYIVTGGEILNPQYIDWLMEGDPAQHWLGWQFFRSSPLLQWPLGANPAYGLQLGSSIVFTDSIPVMAITFKLLNAWLPQDFQYFGLWILVCFVLQAFFSWRLLSVFSTNKLSRAVGTLFFLLAPAFLWRLHGHYALFSHWLLVAALYFYFTDRFPTKRWLALVVLSVLIHAYLAAMVMAILLADLGRRLYTRQRTLGQVASFTVLAFALCGMTMWSLGYFMVGSGVSSSGFGTYRMNLLSLVDPNGTGVEPDGTWSQLLPDQPGLGGDYEGYNYLGSGILSLLLIALYARYRNSGFSVGVRGWPLAILSAGLFIYAISNRIAWGDHEVMVYPLPHAIQHLSETFRASGRFFWPVYYILYAVILGTLFRSTRPRIAIGLCLAMLCVQAVDSQNAWRFFRYKFTQAPTWNSPMSSPLWDELSTRYKAVILVLPGNGPLHWMPIAQFAATHGMATNAGYFARVDAKAEQRLKEQLTQTVQDQHYNPDFLYIFNDDELWNLAAANTDPANVVGVLDGFRIVAPALDSCNECNEDLVSVEQSRLPPYSSGAVSYDKNGNGNLVEANGWSTPDDYGSWSLGETPTVVLDVPTLPKRKLALKLTGLGFLAKGHYVQNVEVTINGTPLSAVRYDMATPGARIIQLPRQLTESANGKLAIHFKVVDPQSPLELGVSEDPRQLGFNLHSLEVISVD